MTLLLLLLLLLSERIRQHLHPGPHPSATAISYTSGGLETTSASASRATAPSLHDTTPLLMVPPPAIVHCAASNLSLASTYP